MINLAIRLHQLTRRFDPQINTWLGSLLSLFLRYYVGWQFFKSGMVKVSDWDATLSLFMDEYHVPLLPPELAAYVGAAGELGFSTLLFLGLFSRPAALGLFCVNAMAVISYPQLFKFECPAAIHDHLYWGISLFTLLAWGPGKITLDEAIAWWAKKRAV